MPVLMEIFLKKYADIIKYFIYSSPYVIENIFSQVRGEDRKEAWKGLIIGKMLEVNKIKQFVQDNLKAMDLSPDTTLR